MSGIESSAIKEDWLVTESRSSVAKTHPRQSCMELISGFSRMSSAGPLPKVQGLNGEAWRRVSEEIEDNEHLLRASQTAVGNTDTGAALAPTSCRKW
jgi:hypothetical protein